MEPHSAISLSKALKGNELLLVHRMLEEGAVVNGKDLDHWRPLHVAAYLGYETLVQDLISHRANPNLLNDEQEAHCTWPQGRDTKRLSKSC